MYETYDEYLRNEYENDNSEEIHDALADAADEANQRELDEREDAE
jgi:hypothetical protein